MTASGSDRRSPPVALGVLLTAVGGAVGAAARWWVTEVFPMAAGDFPSATFAINVVGCGLLAALPLVAAVRRRPWLVLMLGTGVLGGFTTMSAASVETFQLIDQGRSGVALTYCLGTLVAALLAVAVVDRLSPAPGPDAAELEPSRG